MSQEELMNAIAEIEREIAILPEGSITKKKIRDIMDFGEEDFEIEILNTGDIVHNMLEFVNIAGEYV
nr:DUF4869 domain-containing protein [uncultured Blautia sp.]